MPRRSQRSGSYKSRSVRTQSGAKVQSKKKRHGKALCPCGRPLSSVSSRRASSKSSRRSNRPFGGSLCPLCARKKALGMARATD